MSFAPVINDPRTAPTDISLDDTHVREELLRLGEPPTVQNESSSDRLKRLRSVQGAQTPSETNELLASDEDLSEEESDDEFFTPGTEDLLRARKEILEYLVPRAISRNEEQRKLAGIDMSKVLRHRWNIAQKISKYELHGSYTVAGITRALGCVRLNKSNSALAAASWDGSLAVYSVGKELTHQWLLPAGSHTEKATLTWSPTDDGLMVSAGAEGDVCVWSSTELGYKLAHSKKEAHSGRIAQVDVHPSGRYFCTTSFDQTWKLWDLLRPEKELFEQEGHSKEVYACSFHPDGSLLASGGLDALGRVWDLRSGRSIAILDGHVKGIYSMAWSPNGHQLASASGDSSVKIWDLRRQDLELFSIPAHNKLISDVRFLQGGSSALSPPVADEHDENPEQLDVTGTLLVTASYDGTLKIWQADNWVPLHTLRGHTDKVMGCDISISGETLVSCGWDRTIRTWGDGAF